MSLGVTISILVASSIIFGCANYMSRRPSEPGIPKLVPWTGLQFIGLVVVILMLAHLVTLLSGTPLEGRYTEAISSPSEPVGKEDWRGRKSQIVSHRSKQRLRPNVSILTICSGFQTPNSRSSYPRDNIYHQTISIPFKKI